MDYDASYLDVVLLMLTIYKQVANLIVYVENYPIGIATIINVRNDMQAVELLIKNCNKPEVLKYTKEESKIFVCFVYFKFIKVNFLVYVENYPIGIATITNVKNDMQAVELLIKICNKPEVLKNTKEESQLFVCFVSLRFLMIYLYNNETVTITIGFTTKKQ